MMTIRKLSLSLLLSLSLGVPAFAGTTATAEQLTCYEIRSYCYQMWMIRRHNYEQYVGCVLSNAENNGLQCEP